VTFVVVGLSYKTAPIDVREQAFIPPDAVGECVQRLIDRGLIESGVLLSTCNRTELYALTASEQPETRLIEAFGLWPHQLPFQAWSRCAYGLRGDTGLTHLFRVAAGIESMVLGEGQVLGQLKDAVARARQGGVMDGRLDVIMQAAVRAGRRVRHETSLSRTPVSVSHAAVAKARELLPDISNAGILMLGAGPMTEIALRLLHHTGRRNVYVASRTTERAERVAGPLGAQLTSMDRILEIADQVDLVMSSSSAPHVLLDAAAVAEMQVRRANRPLLIIDMAVPRDIDPAAASVEGVTLLDIDGLEQTAAQNRQARQTSLPAAEAIIEEERSRAIQALQARAAADRITAVVHYGVRIRDSVLERHLKRVAADDATTRRVLVELADALTRRLLHQPIEALRHSAEDPLKRTHISEAFGIHQD